MGMGIETGAPHEAFSTPPEEMKLPHGEAANDNESVEVTDDMIETMPAPAPKDAPKPPALVDMDLTPAKDGPFQSKLGEMANMIDRHTAAGETTPPPTHTDFDFGSVPEGAIQDPGLAELDAQLDPEVTHPGMAPLPLTETIMPAAETTRPAEHSRNTQPYPMLDSSELVPEPDDQQDAPSAEHGGADETEPPVRADRPTTMLPPKPEGSMEGSDVKEDAAE